MATPLSGAPAPSPILQRRPVMGRAGYRARGQPAAGLRVDGRAPALGAVFYRLAVMSAAPSPYVARAPGARRVSGVIVPRAFAGPRFAAGVLIPRRARALAGAGTPRFLQLQSGGVLRLQNGDKLQLRQNDNG